VDLSALENDGYQVVPSVIPPEEIPALLQGSVFPVKAEQAGPALLGGGTAKAIADTATFLKEQGKIDQALTDYAPYVDARFVATATATN